MRRVVRWIAIGWVILAAAFNLAFAGWYLVEGPTISAGIARVREAFPLSLDMLRAEGILLSPAICLFGLLLTFSPRRTPRIERGVGGR